MAKTILQKWEETRIHNLNVVKDPTDPVIVNTFKKSFITETQISNWQDFTSRSIAPDRDNPAVQLNNTWAPEGITYFGAAGA